MALWFWRSLGRSFRRSLTSLFCWFAQFSWSFFGWLLNSLYRPWVCSSWLWFLIAGRFQWLLLGDRNGRERLFLFGFRIDSFLWGNMIKVFFRFSIRVLQEKPGKPRVNNLLDLIKNSKIHLWSLLFFLKI